MKLTLLLIPIVFLSSCTVEKSTIHTLPPEKIQIQEKINIKKETQNSGIDFGDGFTLSQTEDETILTYSGKVIKTWSHVPPKKIPFVWDEACTIVWNGFEKLAPENQSTGKQGVWDNLTEKEKKDCMKEYFGKTGISVMPIDTRFYKIVQSYYENYDLWVYDTTTGNMHLFPNDTKTGNIIDSVLVTSDGIVFNTSRTHGDAPPVQVVFDPGFTSIISTRDLPI